MRTGGPAGEANGETAASVEQGDFSAWYEAEHARVLAVLCAAAGDLEVGRESTDEAFARAYARWESVRTMACPAGWTVRVGMNVSRRMARRRTLERRLLARHPPTSEVDAPRFEEVGRLLAPLSPRQRTAMVLRYVADLPEAEIAVVMGVRRGTVASTLAAARLRVVGTADGRSRKEWLIDG